MSSYKKFPVLTVKEPDISGYNTDIGFSFVQYKQFPLRSFHKKEKTFRMRFVMDNYQSIEFWAWPARRGVLCP